MLLRRVLRLYLIPPFTFLRILILVPFYFSQSVAAVFPS